MEVSGLRSKQNNKTDHEKTGDNNEMRWHCQIRLVRLHNWCDEGLVPCVAVSRRLAVVWKDGDGDSDDDNKSSS